jgi:uncharacterized membrane protein YkoI
VYSGDKIDLDKCSFGAKTDVPGSTGNTISAENEADASEYFFYVKANDGSFSAAVDAGNGQILYINNHMTN